MKIILTYCFGLLLFNGFSQNKKEQIEALNFSIDSLNNIIVQKSLLADQQAEVIAKKNNTLDSLSVFCGEPCCSRRTDFEIASQFQRTQSMPETTQETRRTNDGPSDVPFTKKFQLYRTTKNVFSAG